MKQLYIILLFLFVALNSYTQNTKSINQNSAGELSTSLTDDERNSTTDLTITGKIDYRDLYFIKTGLPLLSSLDISEANIEQYTDDNNKTYLANEIPAGCFWNFTQLTSVRIPQTTESIGDLAFSDCTGLSYFYLPSTVSHLGEQVFCRLNCYIDISPANSYFTTINGLLYNNAFTTLYYCPTNTSGILILPNNLQTLTDCVFQNCTSISSISLPASTNEIKQYSFINCSAEIYVSSSNSSYTATNGVLFNKNKTELIHCPTTKSGTYTVPASVTKLRSYCFTNCSNLTSISLPNSIDTLWWANFSYCSNLQSINIPTTTKLILSWAFRGCTKLNSITLPSNLKVIDSNAFMNCTNLSTINCLALTPPLLYGDMTFQNVNKKSCKVYVPSGTLTSYKSDLYWSKFENIIEISTSGFNDKIESTITAYFNKSDLIIKGVTIGEQVCIYDCRGKLVRTITASDETVRTPLNEKIYIIRTKSQHLKVLR